MREPVKSDRGRDDQRWNPQRYAPMAEYLFPASQAAVQAVELRRGDLLVDSATGTGNAAMVAVEGGARVFGVDSSRAQVVTARRRCRHPGAQFVVADAQHLPLPAGCAEAAVSVFGIIFATDPGRALAELVRCVHPGGLVAVTILGAGGWPSQARELLAGMLETGPPPFPNAWGTPEAAGAAVASAGLDAVTVRRHELSFRLDVGQSIAEQVTARMGGLAMQREQLERQGRWPQARDLLDGRLAGCVRVTTDGPALVDRYLLMIGRHG